MADLAGAGAAEPARGGHANADLLCRAAARAAAADREAVAQDLLDAAAVATGLKPAAVAGLGYPLPDGLDRLGEALGLAVRQARPWLPACDADGLPAWYAEGLDRQRRATPVIAVFADAGAGLPAPARPLSPEEEAAFLGYPACCVAAHHDRRRHYHRLTLRMLARQADGDEARMRRLFTAGVRVAPRDAAEAADLRRLLLPAFAPCTSVAMCETCAADADSPARRIAARFRQLAEETGLIRFLSLPT